MIDGLIIVVGHYLIGPCQLLFSRTTRVEDPLFNQHFQSNGMLQSYIFIMWLLELLNLKNVALLGFGYQLSTQMALHIPTARDICSFRGENRWDTEF